MLVDRRLTRELVLRVDSFVESIEECPEWKKAPGALLLREDSCGRGPCGTF